MQIGSKDLQVAAQWHSPYITDKKALSGYIPSKGPIEEKSTLLYINDSFELCTPQAPNPAQE